VGVVADFAVVFAEKLFPGAVGGRRDNGLFRAPFDLGDVKEKQGKLSTLLLVCGATHQDSDFRQGKDSVLYSR